MTWHPSTWDIVGSTAMVVLAILPVYLPFVIVLRRLVRGSW